MPSGYSTSLRFNLQATGENINLWGWILNSGVFALADFAIAGWTTKALTTDYTLSAVNGTSDEARSAMLKFTGTGAFTVTIPAVSKRYDVWNACTGDLTVSNGSASVVVKTGEVVGVVTDGGGNIARVQPTDFGGHRLTNLGTPTVGTDACTKDYADNLAFSSASGNLPGQAGNAGKYLTTNGSVASWATPPYVPLTRNVSTSGLLSGGGALSGDLSLSVSSATATQVRAGTSVMVAMTPGDTYNALAEVTLTDAATITVDMSIFINAVVTLGGNRTLGNPSNPKVGQTGRIRIVQDATGSRTLAYGTNWKFQGGLAPALTTTAGAIDILDYEVITSTFVRAALTKAWA